jgi:hypothetical protein
MSQNYVFHLSSFLAVFCALLLSIACQASPADKGTGTSSDASGSPPNNSDQKEELTAPKTPEEIIARRLKRQRRIINVRLQNGNLTADQAQKLTQSVNDIEANFQQLSTGALKPEDAKRLINSLNQNANELRSTVVSGTSTVQGSNVLGPEWSKGPDGAQNPRTLMQEMKVEHQREMRQERQSNEQKLEMQQQDYEREMVESLGEQRGKILEKKDQLKDVRDESGAN